MENMKTPIRTLMFVPGHKEKWLAKIPGFGADAIVMDLEDSVPVASKPEARRLVAEAIPGLAGKGPELWVRSNKGRFAYDFDDLKAVVQPGLTGIFVSKAEDPEDMEALSRMISEVESEKGMEIGSTGLLPAIETAKASQFLYEIAAHPRTRTIAAVSAKGADLERNFGFTWTPEGIETLYHRSRAVIACRAAGKPFPIGGMWQEVHDLDGLRKQAEFNRQLGFSGEIVLHPSNVAVINEVYSPTEEQLDYYRGLVAAFEEGERQGQGAVIYKGEHIDIAHAQTAREYLALWEAG